MDKYSIDLNGDWRGFGKGERGEDISFCGKVPGCVHTDLMAAGILPDIYYRDNSKLSQWIENESFTYERSFTVPSLMSGAHIEFSGLDTYASVYLNDTLIGSSDNMFLTYSFPVDGVLLEGENHIRVAFRSPIREVAGKPLGKGCFTTERLNTRRMQCTYGWDWVDRFVTQGIFRDVRVVFDRKNRAENVYVYTHSINPYSAEVRVEVDIGGFERVGEEALLELHDPFGKVVFTRKRGIIEPKLYQTIHVKNPALWYPLGYGEQPIYTLKVSTPTSEKEVRFGIRVISILQLEDEVGSPEWHRCLVMREYPHLKDIDKNEIGSSFTVLVNGVKIMCKGANWVPCEPFPSEQSCEKITSLLTLGAIGGVNMLRVWGGGIFESDHFYSECTRLGILVSQDFLMACGSYPEGEEWFIDALRREAQCAALRLRNHTCLAFWTGDNENAVDGNDNITDFPGYRSATYGIAPTLRALDPCRIFLPSSPYGGDKYSSATAGTTHISNFMGEIYHRTLETDLSDFREYFESFCARFITEQPTMGMPFLSSLCRFMKEEDIFGDDESISEFHTKHNPDLGEISVYTFMRTLTERVFGGFVDGADRLLKMQLMQCEWVRTTFELARRGKWFSSGIIYWMFNDCWPAANGWSLIDYYARPKPAFYTFKRCAKPIIASVTRDDEEYRVYICNDSLTEAKGHGTLYVYDMRCGEVVISREFDFSSNANSSQAAFLVSRDTLDAYMNSSRIIICDIDGYGDSDRAYYIENRFSDKDMVYGGVDIIGEDEESITVRAREFSPIALLDLPYLVEENGVTMLKGEVRRIKKIG